MNSCAIQDFNDESQKICEMLKDSPTFAMSLGAKELFHTNFLAFLLQSSNPELQDVKGALKSLLFNSSFKDDVIVLREKSHMDLIIIRKPGKFEMKSDEVIAVVIEAKLKSIPTQKQLDGYKEKLKGSGLTIDLPDEDLDEINEVIDEENQIEKKGQIKLKITDTNSEIKISGCKRNETKRSTLKQPTMVGKIRTLLLAPETELDFLGWEKLTWSEISKCFPTETSESSYVLKLVGEYKKDLDGLINLLSATKELTKEFCKKTNLITLSSLNYEILSPYLKEIRIHDLISKYSYWNISEQLNEIELFKKTDIKVETFFSNSRPGISLYKEILGDGSGLQKIGIQLQGESMNHFLECTGTIANEMKDMVLKYSFWFEMAGWNGLQKLNQYDKNKHLYFPKHIGKDSFCQIQDKLINSFEFLKTKLIKDAIE